MRWTTASPLRHGGKGYAIAPTCGNLPAKTRTTKLKKPSPETPTLNADINLTSLTGAKAWSGNTP